MIKVNIQARDKEVKLPASKRTLFDIKNQYMCDGELGAAEAEELFDLVDFVIDRLLQAESERFRNNY